MMQNRLDDSLKQMSATLLVIVLVGCSYMQNHLINSYNNNIQSTILSHQI